MSLRKEINDRVKNIIDTNFDVEDIDYVPDISNSKLTFGNKGLRFEATVLNIDIRKSTETLNRHNRQTVAKILMSYYHTIVKVAKDYGGEVRSFNGDSLLVFFQGTTKISLSKGVEAAMIMRYLLYDDENGVRSKISKYSAIDFGIGIADGKILCTKVGLGGDSNTKDLVWIGNAVNMSVKLSDSAHLNYAIHISNNVYINLEDYVKYGKEENFLGYEEKIDIWTEDTFDYNDSDLICYKTDQFIEIE
jgi:class 3 adenylate cyclase